MNPYQIWRQSNFKYKYKCYDIIVEETKNIKLNWKNYSKGYHVNKISQYKPLTLITTSVRVSVVKY